ncbi:MAG: outer membrane protein [Paracoccaceae bacterium]|jgi:Skp family chaperone for outer membrane proteins
MKSLKILSTLFLGAFLCSSLSAQDKDDKIGTINMQVLVKDYYKAEQTREAFNGYTKEIQVLNETRIAAIKVLVDEARILHKKAEDPALSREKKQELFKQATSKNQEAQALINARQEWANRKNSALAEKANVEFAALRSEIIALVQKTGEEQGYDFILDRSGSSGAQVPILSYAKDATDLTAVMLEVINADAPAKGAEKEEGSEPE